MTVLCVYDGHHYFVNIFTIDGTTIQYIDSLHFRYQKCLKIGMRPECVNLEFKQSGPKRTKVTVRKRKTNLPNILNEPEVSDIGPEIKSRIHTPSQTHVNSDRFSSTNSSRLQHHDQSGLDMSLASQPRNLRESWITKPRSSVGSQRFANRLRNIGWDPHGSPTAFSEEVQTSRYCVSSTEVSSKVSHQFHENFKSTPNIQELGFLSDPPSPHLSHEHHDRHTDNLVKDCVPGGSGSSELSHRLLSSSLFAGNPLRPQGPLPVPAIQLGDFSSFFKRHIPVDTPKASNFLKTPDNVSYSRLHETMQALKRKSVNDDLQSLRRLKLEQPRVWEQQSCLPTACSDKWPYAPTSTELQPEAASNRNEDDECEETATEKSCWENRLELLQSGTLNFKKYL